MSSLVATTADAFYTGLIILFVLYVGFIMYRNRRPSLSRKHHIPKKYTQDDEYFYFDKEIFDEAEDHFSDGD